MHIDQLHKALSRFTLKLVQAISLIQVCKELLSLSHLPMVLPVIKVKMSSSRFDGKHLIPSSGSECLVSSSLCWLVGNIIKPQYFRKREKLGDWLHQGTTQAM